VTEHEAQKSTPTSNIPSPSDIFSMYAADEITEEQADKLFREAAAGPGPFSEYDITILETDGYITPEQAADLLDNVIPDISPEDDEQGAIDYVYGPDYKGCVQYEGTSEQLAQRRRNLAERMAKDGFVPQRK